VCYTVESKCCSVNEPLKRPALNNGILNLVYMLRRSASSIMSLPSSPQHEEKEKKEKLDHERSNKSVEQRA
jgi:hypothetical protein